jgi:hypothetical protein
MDLFDRMSLLGGLSPPQQEHLLLATLYNDLRLFEDDAQARENRIRQLFSSEKQSITGKFCGIKLNLPITRRNWRQQITKANEMLQTVPGTKLFERSFVLNSWLVRSGLCPLVRFAFDQWYELGSFPGKESPILESVVDLSTTYLYRLIPVQEAVTTDNKIGGGAYSNVYKSSDGKSVYKVPKNMAAFRFASQDELKASLFAAQTDLAQFLPALIGYNPHTGVIEREFIAGQTGFQMMKTGASLSLLPAPEQLEKIHRTASDIYARTRINFDIHSGNMIWSEEKDRWVLVDLGPMPKIGAEYFPRGKFESYFQKIWVDVHRLMIDVPIRSLDINMRRNGLSVPACAMNCE